MGRRFPSNIGTISTTGTMLIFTMISNSRPLQMVVKWLLTPNQRRLMALFRLSKAWRSNLLYKKCLRGHWPSQGYLYEKIAGLFWQLFQNSGQKTVLVPWYPRHHSNMTRRNKRRNPSKRVARTRWQQGRSASVSKPLLFLWWVFRPAFASKAAGVQNSAAGLGRQRNDF